MYIFNQQFFKIEITREIGEDNIFLFGNLAEDVEDLRRAHVDNPNNVNSDSDLAAVFDAIRGGMFGNPEPFAAIISAVVDQADYYLVSDDFQSYIKTQDLVDEFYRDQDRWLDKCILSVARMGFFSADRVVNEYADCIWNIEPAATQEQEDS